MPARHLSDLRRDYAQAVAPNLLMDQGATKYYIPAVGRTKEADCAFLHINKIRPPGGPVFPNLPVEMGWSESLLELDQV